MVNNSRYNNDSHFPGKKMLLTSCIYYEPYLLGMNCAHYSLSCLELVPSVKTKNKVKYTWDLLSLTYGIYLRSVLVFCPRLWVEVPFRVRLQVLIWGLHTRRRCLESPDLLNELRQNERTFWRRYSSIKKVNFRVYEFYVFILFL